MVMHIVFPDGRHIKLGTFLPLHKESLKAYVRRWQMVWIEL